MATLCKNCATPLVFDPNTQRVVCHTCGGSWTAEEVESSAKEFLEDTHAVAAKDVYGEAKKEFLNCYIYTCSSCGGEIIINGSEASTQCIYCGSSSVVFDRISKEKAPEFIIPFKLSKEKAVELIKAKFSRGIFVPKEIKNFKPTAVRGIYIPYWITNGYHVEADIIAGQVKSGKHTVTRYFGRAGKMSINNLLVDASLMLSDESSQRLEPFDISEIKEFDEDYLLGFYSNISDISTQDLQLAVNKRAAEAFQEEAKSSVKASGKRVKLQRSATIVDRDVRYTMLPVWFVTYDFQGRHNTIMVNGQTGKIVCGVPWNEKAFFGAVAGLGAVLTGLLAWFMRYKFLIPFIQSTANSHSSRNNPGGLVTMAIMIGIAIFCAGLAAYKKVSKQLSLSQSPTIFNFMKKRQG